VDLATLATPDTLLRWYRELVARKYTAKRPTTSGRPPVDADLEAAIVRLAEENRT
jgi:hypothetical protein